MRLLLKKSIRKKPLSDRLIAEALDEVGIHISRRTESGKNTGRRGRYKGDAGAEEKINV